MVLRLKTLPTHGLAVAFYAKPQDSQFAEMLYRGAINFLGWDNPSTTISNEFMPDPRMFALGLTMSLEFDDQVKSFFFFASGGRGSAQRILFPNEQTISEILNKK